MAGATAAILFPAHVHDLVASWERVVAEHGGESRGLLPFYSHVVHRGTPEWERSDDECESIRAGFGFDPSIQISIAAVCRGVESDRVLGHLALAILRQHEGVLLFHGLLAPTRDHFAWHEWFRQSVREQVALFPGAIGAHRGKVIAATWEEPMYHVVNEAFLAFWMEHPAFHFVN